MMHTPQAAETQVTEWQSFCEEICGEIEQLGRIQERVTMLREMVAEPQAVDPLAQAQAQTQTQRQPQSSQPQQQVVDTDRDGTVAMMERVLEDELLAPLHP